MFFQKKWMLAGLAITCLCLMGAERPARGEPLPARTLASVNNQPITVAAFEAEMARRPAQTITPEQKEALLEEMVRLELIFAAALKANYDKDPEVQASYKRLVVNKYREDVLQPRLEKITVSDKELEDYYNKHKAAFVTPAAVRAAIIRISLSANASKNKKAELLKRAGEARAEALDLSPSTPSFGPVAVRYSDHQATRYRGGDTGWIAAGRGESRWPEEVTEAIFSLKDTGKVSPVITTPTGYYIVKLMETRESAARPFAAVKERIGHQVLSEKKAKVERQFYEELKGKVPVRVDRALLGEVKTPKGGAQQGAGKPPALPGQ